MEKEEEIGQCLWTAGGNSVGVHESASGGNSVGVHESASGGNSAGVHESAAGGNSAGKTRVQLGDELSENV